MVCRVFQINQESVSWEGTRLSAPWQVEQTRIYFSSVNYYIIARCAEACDLFLASLSKIFHSKRKIPFSLCIQNLRMMRIYKGSLIELSLRLLLLPKTRTRLICWKPVCLGTLSFQWTYLPGTDSTLRALPSFLIPSLWPPKIQLLIAISIF